MKTVKISTLSLIGVLMVGVPLSGAEAPPTNVNYAEHVRPILRQHCFACHSTEEKNGDLALDSYESLIEGGASGEVVAAGNTSGSRLWQLVNHEEEPAMPPEQEKLPEAELAVIRAWIDSGLRKDAQSKARPMAKATIATVEVSADNRPQGEPAMPENWWREPIVFSPSAGPVTAIAASPWAPLVAVAGQRQVSLYHSASNQLLGIAPFFEGVPHVLRFSRDGSLLLAGGGRGGALGKVNLYDVKSGRQVASVGDELDLVLAADVSADLALVALGGPRRVVRIFSTGDGKLLHEIRKHTDWVTALEFSPDGKSLVTADRVGGMHLWESTTARPLADLRGHKELITSVSWRLDSQLIASAGKDGTVRLWQPDGKQAKSWQAHPGGAESVRFYRDGRLVTAGRDRHVGVWAGDGNNIGKLGPLPGEALVACFAHDGTRVVAGGFAGNVQMFAVDGGAELAALPPNPPTLAMRIDQTRGGLAQAEQHHKTAAEAATAAQEKLLTAQTSVANHAQQLSAAESQLRELSEAKEIAARELAALVATAKSATDALAAATQRVDETQQLVADVQRLVQASDQQQTDSESSDGSADGEPKEGETTSTAAELQAKLEKANADLASAQNAQQAAQKQLTATGASRDQEAAAAQEMEKAWQELSHRVTSLREQTKQLPDVAALQTEAGETRAARDRAVAAIATARGHLDTALDEQIAFLALKQQLAVRSRERLSIVEQADAALKSTESTQNNQLEDLSRRAVLVKELAERLAAIQAEHAKAVEEHKVAQQRVNEEAAKVAAANESLRQAEVEHAAAADLESQFAEAEKLRAQYVAKTAKH